MEKKEKQTKKETKTEEQIREEVRAEIIKENELKEQAKKELEDRQKEEEMKAYNKKKKARNVTKIIVRVLATLLLLFVLFETIMGILDMNRLNDDKEPLWYIDSKVEVKDNKEITTYNIGLYVIEKVKDEKETKIILKPFFLR